MDGKQANILSFNLIFQTLQLQFRPLGDGQCNTLEHFLQFRVLFLQKALKALLILIFDAPLQSIRKY